MIVIIINVHFFKSNLHSEFLFMFLSLFRKGQQYDCKWYIPLADLTFQTIDESESSLIPQIPDEEIDALKVKISQMKNEIQREKVEIVL